VNTPDCGVNAFHKLLKATSLSYKRNNEADSFYPIVPQKCDYFCNLFIYLNAD
jgi:hypothetical protein